MAKGQLKIYVGPNGYGKTTLLKLIEGNDDIKDDVFQMIETELDTTDNLKDTKDSSITMKILLESIIFSKDEKSTKDLYENIENHANIKINNNIEKINEYANQILKLNNSEDKGFNSNLKPLIETTNNKIEIKKIVEINGEFVKSTGAGQRKLFILKFLSLSHVKNIIIDEPENYCHPTLINLIAEAINDLLDKGKNVFIATHSPRLVKSLKNLEIENINILNEKTNEPADKQKKGKKGTPTFIPKPKTIDLKKVIKNFEEVKIENFYKTRESSEMYLEIIKNEDSLKKYLIEIKNSFIDMLFAKKCYLVEGLNDKIFLKKLLSETQSQETNDYEIIEVFGKYDMPILLSIFNNIKNKEMEINSIFDLDYKENRESENKNQKIINDFIMENSNKYLSFNENIEIDLKFNPNDRNENKIKNFSRADKKYTLKWIEFLNKKDSDFWNNSEKTQWKKYR